MGDAGWPVLLGGWPWFRGAGRYPLPAYSEFMPPPRLVRKPYGEPVQPALDTADALGFLGRLLQRAYGEAGGIEGLRILSPGTDDGPLPGWAAGLRWEAGQSLRGVRYLLTFRPLAHLPAAVRRAYLAGDLCLLPF